MTRDQTEDRALVRRCLRNDQAAYKALLDRYQRPVFALVRRMVANEEEARDLAQEAFIRAFKNLKQFDQSRKFSSWLFRIANNLCIDHYRRRKLDTVPMVRHTAGEEEETWDLPDTGPSPAETFSDRERARRLLAVIESLPPVYRMVILLRHQQGLAYDEIAETMDLPLGTVKARIHRAHKLLKEKLSRQGLDWVPGEDDA